VEVRQATTVGQGGVKMSAQYWSTQDAPKGPLEVFHMIHWDEMALGNQRMEKEDVAKLGQNKKRNDKLTQLEGNSIKK
jgi:hypothetical protein